MRGRLRAKIVETIDRKVAIRRLWIIHAQWSCWCPREGGRTHLAPALTCSTVVIGSCVMVSLTAPMHQQARPPPIIRGNTVVIEHRSASSDAEKFSVDIIEVKDGRIQSLRAYAGWRAIIALTGGAEADAAPT